MDINFELYKIFFHAAQTGSFSEAAKRLFITQSAVSQAIKNLETKLDLPLFFRKGRTLSLTPEGELLFAHIEQAYHWIRGAELQLTECQNMESGVIRIGASDTVCKYYLLAYLQDFNQLFPKLKIQVVNRTSLQIMEILKHGAIDFGIVTLPSIEKSIATRPLIAVNDIFVAGAKFAILQGRKVSLAELTDYPLLMLEKASATRRLFDEFFQRKSIEVIPEIELESIDLLVEFARIGLGIAQVQQESALPAIHSGELFKVDLNEALPERWLGIATLNNKPLSRAAQKFVELLDVKKPTAS